MPDSDEHLALRVGVLDLLHPHNLFLAEHLDGVEPTVVARLDEMDATERTRSEPVSTHPKKRKSRQFPSVEGSTDGKRSENSRSSNLKVLQRILPSRLPNLDGLPSPVSP